MGLKFFGQYLVDRAQITSEQLLAALASDNGKDLANLALAKGYVTSDQMQRVLKHQHKKGFNFRDTAVDKGVLTEAQVEYLSYVSKSNTRRLGEVLVEQGALTAETLATLIAEFKRDYTQPALAAQSLPRAFAGRVDMVALINAAEYMFSEIGVAPVQIRSPSVISGRVTLRDYGVRLELSGDQDGQLLLSLDRPLALCVAGKLFPGAALDTDDLLHDGVAELCNLIAGAASTSLSTRGCCMEFEVPQELRSDAPVGFLMAGAHWPVQTPFSCGDIMVA